METGSAPKGRVEVLEKEIDVLPHQSGALQINEDKIDAILRLAEKSEELGKALDKLRTFVLKRALPGDFVRFKGRDGDEGTIELCGPGADRIGAALGFSYVGWRDWKESGTDEKGPWYTWYYECTVLFSGRRLEGIIGRAGSRDKFFGFAYGQLKALADVNEADIRTAARRNCLKEGIKIALGLRRLPESQVAALGLDPSKIKSVEFGSKKDGTTSSDADAGGSVVTKIVDVVVKRKQEPKDGKKGYTIFAIKGGDGKSYETFSETMATAAKAKKGENVMLLFEATKYGLNLKAIEAVPVDEAADQPGDDA